MKGKSILFMAGALLLHTFIAQAQTAKNVQQKSFDSFWKIFNDNYAFFKLKKVNWAASYKQYTPLVTAHINNDSLFNIMSAMVKPLHDSHVNIIDPVHKKKFNAGKPSLFVKEFNTDSLQKAYALMVDGTLQYNGFDKVKGYGPQFKGVHLFYFSKSAKNGYLRFTRCFSSIIDGEIDEADLQTTLLDSLLNECRNLKGMIVDVRNNIGGDDKFSYEIAGRFTAKKRIGHYKQERIPGTNRYTPLQKWIIKPKGQYTFTQPVMVLTNDKTVSAADVFSLIMKQLPQVWIIGQNSEGCYSDMMTSDLPNGFTVTLSNQKYYSPQMVCYKGSGTPTNVQVANSRSDLTTKIDPVIAKALQLLAK